MQLQLLIPVFAIFLAMTVNSEYSHPNYQTDSLVSSVPTYYPGNYISSGYQPKVTREYVPEIKNGVPVDTPEVQQARAEHFALYAKAAAAAEAAKAADAYKQQGGRHDDGCYRPDPAYYSSPPSHYTPAVGGGTSYAYQSHGYLSNSGLHGKPLDDHHRYRRSLLGYPLHHEAQLQHVPVITKDGVPVETPEVQAAKAQHLLAHAQASAGHQDWSQSNNADHSSIPGIWINYGTPEINKVQYSISHNYGGWRPYAGPQHYPQIDKNGNPVETPEVQIAKHQHFLAHSQAKLGLYGHGQPGSYYGSSFSHLASITPNGVPEETPEVKVAKARHFEAHAKERAKHVKWASQAGSGYGDGYSYEISSHY